MRSAVSGAVAVALIGLVGPASADDATDSGAGSAQPATTAEVPEIAGEPVTGDATFVIGGSEIADAREEAVENEEAHGLSRADEKKEQVLIDAVEADGRAIDDDAIDVVPLLDGDVTLTVPVDVEVDKVVVEIQEGEVAVSATTSEASTPIAESSGPGLSPYWAYNGDGDYVLTVRGIGNALFTWSRSKLMDDGNGSYTWYAYKRKGDAHPYEVTGPNARVSKLRVQNWPYDSVEPNLVNWNEWDPGSSFSGVCGGHSYNAGISVFSAGFGLSFQDCDKYTVWRNANKPGSYWIEMDQGVVLNGGSRQAGYALAWKQKQGTTASQHDFQRVVFYDMWENHECSHTDSGDTC